MNHSDHLLSKSLLTQAKQELKIIYANQPAELLGGSPDKNQPASVAFQARNVIPSFALP